MTIAEALSIENSIRELISQIRKDIINEIKTTPNPDYNPINSFCGTVRLAVLQKNQIWSPEYYMPEAQAKFVESVLQRVSTARSLQDKIRILLNKESVIYEGSIQRLNPITLSVLSKYMEEE